MFVVLIGTVITLIESIAHPSIFAWSITAWLALTVLFANFAEAVAEGRGKAQADTLRKMRSDTEARRLGPDGAEELVPAAPLAKGDVVVCEAGDLIPSDGEIIEGLASIDESAITGESAPVIRESGGDRSAVTGGTKVLSDRVVVRITAERGHTFMDRMISLVEGANRQKTPNEVALTILLAALTIVFLPVVVTLQPFSAFARRHGLRRRADRPARLPDPDHDRRAAVRHRDRRHGPAGAAQRAGDVRPGGGGGRRRADAAARQDRDDHPRQPDGLRVPPRRRPQRAGTGGAPPSSPRSSDETPEGRSIVVLAKERLGIRQRELADGHAFIPFTAADPDVGPGRRRQADPQGRRRGGSQRGSSSRAATIPAELDRVVERIARSGATPLAVPTARTCSA